MQWDNSPVYRRRRRAVGGAAVVLLGGIVLGATQLDGGQQPATPAAEAAPDTTASSVSPAPSPSASATAGGTTITTQGSTPLAVATDPNQATITLAFGGDVQAHGSAGRINTVGLGEAGAVLAKADLAMVNLETVVVEDQTGLVPQPKTYTFATGPQILTSLKDAGVDVVTAANNHAMDFGATGLERMLTVKATSPVPIVGMGKDDTDAWAPWTTEVKGRKVTVFGATDVLDDTLDWKAGPGKPGLAKVKDTDGFGKLLAGVRQARQQDPGGVVVVYLHSGIELHRCPTLRQQATDRALAEAGANVVIGSHAHILQPATTIGDTAVEYGMGNFVFPAVSRQTTATGVLTVTVPGEGPATMAFEPARITNGLPVLLTGSQKEQAVAEWQDLGQGCS